MELSIDTITQLSPPLALALFLNFVGFFIKKSPINNIYIPLILMLLGAGIYPFIADIASIDEVKVRNPFMLHMIYGACIAGLSVATHQTFTSFMQSKETSDTQFIKKNP